MEKWKKCIIDFIVSVWYMALVYMCVEMNRLVVIYWK